MPLFLLPSNAYNRAAIMRQAWSRARAIAASMAVAPGSFRRVVSPASLFADELRRAWDIAKGERAYAVWLAEQQAGRAAEAVRREALAAHDRDLEDAHAVLLFAEHSDATGAHVRIAAARARLASLQQAA